MYSLSSKKILQSNTILLFCLAAFIPVHLVGINQHGFWGDEVITARVSLLPLKELIANRLAAGHFPSYFILIKYWGNLFGTSEVSLRLPSILIMAAAFGGLWQFSRKFFAAVPGAALLFLLLFFFNPTVFRLSQEARMYGPLVCAAIFCTYYFLQFLEKENLRSLIFCITFLMLSLAIHAQAFILLAGQLIYLSIFNRRMLVKYAGALFLPLLIFILVWQSGSADYKVDHLPPSFKPVAVISILARAGMFAAGETDAFLFRIPPWADLNVTANVIFLFFLASTLHWLVRSRQNPASAEESLQSSVKALYFILFLLAFYFSVMVVMGVMNLRGAHRVRYFIIIYPFILAIVAIGAVNLGKFLEDLWHGLQWLVSSPSKNEGYSEIPWSDNTIYTVSRLFAGSIILVFAFFYLHALNLQLTWKGPGYKEVILLLKENYQNNEPVITCCMPKIEYGFTYYGADHIRKRLHLPRMKSVSYTTVRIKRITGKSDRVWFLFYRNIPEMTDPALHAFENAYGNYSVFLDKQYPVARLLGYEKIQHSYDSKDPFGWKKNLPTNR